MLSVAPVSKVKISGAFACKYRTFGQFRNKGLRHSVNPALRPHTRKVGISAAKQADAETSAADTKSSTAPQASVFRKVAEKFVKQKPLCEKQITYAQLLEYLQNKRILNLSIYDDGKEAIAEVCVPGYEDEPEESREAQFFNCMLPGDYHQEVLKLAKEANSKEAGPDKGNCVCQMVYVDPQSMYPPIVGKTAMQVLPIAAFWLFRSTLSFVEFVKRGGEPKKTARMKVAEALGSTRATQVDTNTTGVLFSDVAGVDHAVLQFQEIIDIMLGDPRYKDIGATLPKGVLLEGPPGTGKTLLAKAVAGEAGVPFFSANGSEFVEMFVGVAAARVRDLFKKARANTPAIVFIDEIDTIGRARGKTSGPDNDEREQGLLQLLVEMDGFSTKDEKVLVIGATNLRSTLDPALLRAGRFDRICTLGLPSMANRLRILQVHARGKLICRDGDEDYETDALLSRTAELTVGYSGAELANLLNEAAIIAVRREKPEIGMSELEVAMEKMKLGLARPPLEATDEKRKVAYVEAGRAVLITVNSPAVPDVLQVSVQPRGNRVSHVATVPKERDGATEVQSYDDYIRLMSIALAGRATEEVVQGKMGVTLLTSPELAEVTQMAVRLVGQSGLHPDFDTLTFDEEELMSYPKAQVKMDAAVRDAMEEAYRRAVKMVKENRPAIDALVDLLMERDTVYGRAVRDIVKNSEKVTIEEEEVVELTKPIDVRSSTNGEVHFFGAGMGMLSFSKGKVSEAGDKSSGTVPDISDSQYSNGTIKNSSVASEGDTSAGDPNLVTF